MNNTAIIDRIIENMAADLSGELLSKLRIVCIEAFADEEPLHTEVSTEVNDNMTYLKKYAVELKVQQKADGTIKQYLYATKNFLDAVGKNFREITSDDVILYFARLQKQGYKPVHMDNLRRYIKTFFNWLMETDAILRNPFYRMKAIRKPQKEKITLTDAEVEAMRDASNSVYDRALTDFLMSTGCRVSEVTGLTWDKIDLERGRCRVYAVKTRDWRTVYLDAKAAMHMKTLKEIDRKGTVFGNCTVTIEQHVRQIAERAELEKHVTVHTFRRTFASRLFSRGMDIMLISRLLGHSTTATTMQYYIKIDEAQTKAEFDRVA